MKLNPELIPHNKFHKGIWLTTPNLDWYYFINKDREFSIPQSKGFNKTLDPFIIPVVNYLHSNSIPTTPSCSGHFYDGKKYANVYDGLDENRKLINSSGIKMKDCETGTRYFYKNEKYKLPWKKNDFIDQVLEYQKKGVLGLYDPRNYFYNTLPIDNFETIKDDNITLYVGNFINERECKESWKSFYNQIQKVI